MERKKNTATLTASRSGVHLQFWTQSVHLVLILQPACWSELPCFIGNLVHISPGQSSPTSDSSHGAHGYILEAVCWALCTRMLHPNMTLMELFSSDLVTCGSTQDRRGGFCHWTVTDWLSLIFMSAVSRPGAVCVTQHDCMLLSRLCTDRGRVVLHVLLTQGDNSLVVEQELLLQPLFLIQSKPQWK